MVNKQKVLTGLIIFCTLLAISFNTNFVETNWLWSGYPFVALVLILSAFVLAKIWLNIEHKRIEHKINSIQQKKYQEQSLLDLLSEREHKVFKSIVEGKSNKEIAHELNVALSTIKTHINNIYKALKVSNRADLKKIVNKQ